MSLETVKKVIRRFLTDEKPSVLALKGKWGVGKTYLWNAIIMEMRTKISPPYYCYISLFGITSIKELRTSIYLQIQPVQLIGQQRDFKTVNKDWLLYAKRDFKKIRTFVTKLEDLPYSKSISVGLESIVPHLIKDTVICFDDFERLGTNGITPDEVMGFISSLKEENNCKVVLVFNDEQLGAHKDVYNTYREKVVDVELMYEPTPLEAAKVALPADMPWREMAARYSISLGLTNIRLLRKIVDMSQLIHAEICDLHAAVHKQAVATIVLFIWAHYEKNPDKPDWEYIKKWRLHLRDEPEKNPNDRKWNEILRQYGITDIDDFDLAIVGVIERGYCEESGLKNKAIKIDRLVRNGELKEPYAEVWNKFRNSFAHNEEELACELVEAFKKAIHLLSANDLDSCNASSCFRAGRTS